MQFKEGMGWKACFDEARNLYTAETWGMGSYHLYEITGAIYSQLTKSIDSGDAERLIHTGRHLYMDINDRCGPPYTVVLDEDYRDLCPWASVQASGKEWPVELTDAAVEIFASEKQNREQRRKKREQRQQKETGRRRG